MNHWMFGSHGEGFLQRNYLRLLFLSRVVRIVMVGGVSPLRNPGLFLAPPTDMWLLDRERGIGDQFCRVIHQFVLMKSRWIFGQGVRIFLCHLHSLAILRGVVTGSWCTYTQMPFNYYIWREQNYDKKNSTENARKEKPQSNRGLMSGGKVVSVNEQQKKTPILIGGSE